MEIAIIFKSLISLLAVIAVFYVLLKLIQKYSKVGISSKSHLKGSGLKIENIVYIDETTKVANLIDGMGNSYIIAISKNNCFLVDKYQNHIEKDETDKAI